VKEHLKMDRRAESRFVNVGAWRTAADFTMYFLTTVLFFLIVIWLK